MAARPLEELVSTVEPAMALVRAWMGEARNHVEVLACDAAAGAATLLALQVTTRSPMGALGFETGGLLVDRGWLRILGAGSPRLPRSLASWNGLPGPVQRHRAPGTILVADDVTGGFFALNGGGLPGQPGTVFYYAPDTLRWEDLGMGYSDWLNWTFKGDLAKFYGSTRWPGWEAEVGALAGDRAISFYPFLWAEGPPLVERHRGAVPIEELWTLNLHEVPKQLRS